MSILWYGAHMMAGSGQVVSLLTPPPLSPVWLSSHRYSSLPASGRRCLPQEPCCSDSAWTKMNPGGTRTDVSNVQNVACEWSNGAESWCHLWSTERLVVMAALSCRTRLRDPVYFRIPTRIYLFIYLFIDNYYYYYVF